MNEDVPRSQSQLTRTERITNVTSQLICLRKELTSKSLAEKLRSANSLQKIDLTGNLIRSLPTLEMIHHS